jgi:hypothetical protein
MNRGQVSSSVLGAVGLAAVLLAAGCSSGQPGDLTVAAEKVLVPKVQQVRDVAATGNYSRLKQVVRQLDTLVRRELADGQVSQSRANAILDAADALLTDAQPTSSPAPSPSQSSSSSPSPSAMPSSTPSATPSTTPSASSSSSPSPGTTVTIGGIPH